MSAAVRVPLYPITCPAKGCRLTFPAVLLMREHLTTAHAEPKREGTDV